MPKPPIVGQVFRKPLKVIVTHWLTNWPTDWQSDVQMDQNKKNVQFLYRSLDFAYPDSILTCFRPYLMLKWANILVHIMITFDISWTIHVNQKKTVKR